MDLSLEKRKDNNCWFTRLCVDFGSWDRDGTNENGKIHIMPCWPWHLDATQGKCPQTCGSSCWGFRTCHWRPWGLCQEPRRWKQVWIWGHRISLKCHLGGNFERVLDGTSWLSPKQCIAEQLTKAHEIMFGEKLSTDLCLHWNTVITLNLTMLNFWTMVASNNSSLSLVHCNGQCPLDALTLAVVQCPCVHSVWSLSWMSQSAQKICC